MSEHNKYVLRTVAAEPRNHLNINTEGPHVLINDAHANENVLGVLPRQHFNEPNWVCILPLQQPQGAQRNGSYAGMNTPVIDRWCTIDQLNHDLFAPNMRFVLQHLEEPGAAIGFNYSPDPHTRLIGGSQRTKFKPNSWDHFHMHWMTGIDNATQRVWANDRVTIRAGRQPMDVRPHRYLSEMLPHVVDSVLDQEYRNLDLVQDKRILNAEEKSTLPYAPHGGIVFALPAEIYADQALLGQAIKDIHSGFTTIHQNIWNVFVANYDAVKASDWTEPYIMRPQNEITERLLAFTDNESIREGMIRFFSALRPESHVANPMNWLYKGPSHSMAVYKHSPDYILSVLPHLMHPTNWLAALGIFEVRDMQSGDLDHHRSQASAHANRLGATVLPPIVPSPERDNSI